MFTPKLEIPERGLLIVINHRRFREGARSREVWGDEEGKDLPVHHRPRYSRFPSLQLRIQIPRRLSSPVRLRGLRVDNVLLGHPGRSKAF